MSKAFKEVILADLTFTGPNGQLSPQQVVKLPLACNKGFNLTAISEALLSEAPKAKKNLVSSVYEGSDIHELKVEFLTEVIEDAKAKLKAEAEIAQQATADKHRNDRINQRIAELQDGELDAELGEITDIEQLKAMRS